jgi:hypothetical protein
MYASDVEVKNDGAIPPFPHISPRCGAKPKDNFNLSYDINTGKISLYSIEAPHQEDA